MRRTRSQTNKQKNKKQVTPSWQDKLQFAGVGYRRGAAGTPALTPARRRRHQTARHYFDRVENDEAAPRRSQLGDLAARQALCSDSR